MLSPSQTVFLLAPAIVYRLRARSAWAREHIDGWRVWLAVIVVAWGLRLALAYTTGEPVFSRAIVTDGIVAGLVAASLTTGAQAAGKPLLEVLRGVIARQTGVELPDVSEIGTTLRDTTAAPPDLTPNTAGTPRAADLDFTGDPR